MNIRVADFIASFLKKKGIKNIFMLTGYGAMYLNDAIKLSGIKYYATRNEATAPIMAESYARLKKKLALHVLLLDLVRLMLSQVLLKHM